MMNPNSLRISIQGKQTLNLKDHPAQVHGVTSEMSVVQHLTYFAPSRKPEKTNYTFRERMHLKGDATRASTRQKLRFEPIAKKQ